jgi:CobQ-like glutamine amidotransferase family enzyme
MDLTLGWLYYDLMNTYGDRGNVLILKKRAEDRGFKIRILEFSVNSSYQDLLSCDLLIMGGAEDLQQNVVSQDLVTDKKKALLEKIEQGIPGLYICGAYQFLGDYYELPDGTKLPGLGALPIYTKSPSAAQKRLIGDIVVQITNPSFSTSYYLLSTNYSYPDFLIGFENHGGRTYINNKQETINALNKKINNEQSNFIGKVLKGYGNNDTDQTEGYVYKNTIGTYLHGPILPRNPQIADFLIAKARN